MVSITKQWGRSWEAGWVNMGGEGIEGRLQNSTCGWPAVLGGWYCERRSTASWVLSCPLPKTGSCTKNCIFVQFYGHVYPIFLWIYCHLTNVWPFSFFLHWKLKFCCPPADLQTSLARVWKLPPIWVSMGQNGLNCMKRFKMVIFCVSKKQKKSSGKTELTHKLWIFFVNFILKSSLRSLRFLRMNEFYF